MDRKTIEAGLSRLIKDGYIELLDGVAILRCLDFTSERVEQIDVVKDGTGFVEQMKSWKAQK